VGTVTATPDTNRCDQPINMTQAECYTNNKMALCNSVRVSVCRPMYVRTELGIDRGNCLQIFRVTLARTRSGSRRKNFVGLG